MKKLRFFLFVWVIFLFTACSGGNSPQSPNASSTPPPVNGFGISANHVHSMVILPDAQQTIVMATHYGIFRSQDHGATWQETASGPNQLMQGLMTWWLSYNPLDPRRLYVLTQIVVIPHPGVLGLYTSGDGGKTWQMAISYASVSSNNIYLAQAGNDSPSEVYIYLSEQGPLGLKVSMDNGAHFAQAGSRLPFGSVLGVLPLPGQPGHLLVFGNEGIARTSDGGQHWQLIKNVEGSIFEITTSGPREPIYAEGDAGVYVSRDGGQSFTLVYTQHSYSSLTVSPRNPNVVYGKLGLGVYRSSDGGQNWQQLPAIKGNLQVLVADPSSVNQVYLALSYPTEVYHFQSTNNAWHSLTPPV